MRCARFLSLVATVAVSAVVWGGGHLYTFKPRGPQRIAEPDESSLTYPVVDTGQTACYDALAVIDPPGPGEPFYGQDAQVAGARQSYVVSADGLTVLDAVTGLAWTRSPDTNGDGVIDATDKKSWVELPSFVDALNAASFGGFSDWRVPTIKELYSLIDFRGTDPAPEITDPAGLVPFVDLDAFDFGYGDLTAGERLIDAQYWSSTAYVSTTMNGNATVFGVNFADGRIKGYPRDVGPGGQQVRYLRLVRGNPAYGVNDLVDNGDGTVTDRATGLQWQQADSGAGMTWEEALAYAEDLQLGGHDDWRLPNAKELQSLIDYGRSPDITGSAAIDPLFAATAVDNENLELDFPAYWTGTTHASASATQVGASAVYLCFGRGMGFMFGSWLDVHGAGSQRSDPKNGEFGSYTYVPYGYYRGSAPQGDALRVLNFVRCVRDTTTGFTVATASTEEIGGTERRRAHASRLAIPTHSGNGPVVHAVSVNH